MLISYKWLKKYLPELDSISKEDIAEALTTKLAEVESIKPIRTALRKVFAAEVLSTKPVEGSKKLSYCEVALNQDTIKKVVCGAPNVIKGAKVALVLAGGQVYDAHATKNEVTFSVESRDVMGIHSEGMICSAKELGLGNDHEGILILESDIAIGVDLTEILADYIFEIENKSISHRPDCFSHKGIAREIAAFFNLKLIENSVDIPVIPTNKLPFEVKVKTSSDLCTRFVSICLADAVVQPSPLWLQSILSATGIRPINNIVDAANYVMFDKGQPLHTYDYDQLAEKKLTVRMARNDELLMGLDEKEYKLDESMQVISSGNKIDNIAGIIGGAHSEITSSTKNIIIEAANFNMYSIRRTSRKLGIRTEASTRFEKGQDPELAIEGLISAVQLICDLSQAEVASEISDIYLEKRNEREIKIDLSLVPRFLGVTLTTKEIISYLERLGLVVADVEKIPNESVSPEINLDVIVTIPTYRNDIQLPADILEEIARMYGYEKFEPTLPKKEITSQILSKGLKLQRALISSLSASGLDEIQTYSFVAKSHYEKLLLKIEECLALKNPLSPETTHMRNLLLPNMLAAIELNANKRDAFGFFETGRVVYKALDDNNIHLQPFHVAGLHYEFANKVQYFIVKGALEQLADDLGLKFDFTPLSDKHHFIGYRLLHPGRSAVVSIQGEDVGFIGELHPEITQNLNIEGRVGIFELNASKLSEYATYKIQYQEPSIFQEIHRDMTFWLSKEKSFAEVIANLENIDELVTNVSFKDIFTKDDDTNNKALTISITLQSQSKTLTDNEINQVIEKIKKTLEREAKAEFKN